MGRLGLRVLSPVLAAAWLAVPVGACAGGAVETAGNVALLGLAGAAAAAPAVRGDAQGGLQLGESLAATLAATYGLKYAVQAERPDGSGDDSFPSGHASVAFSSAEFLRKRYGWEYGVPAYAVATFVGFSRVEARRHRVADVLAGAALGFGCSYLFTGPYEGWSAQVEGDSRYLGLRLSRGW